MTRVSTVISTNDQAFRAHLTQLLRASGLSIAITDEKHLPGGTHPQLAIVDVRSGAKGAHGTLERLRATWPASILIAVASSEQPDEILQAMRSGANEFLAWMPDTAGTTTSDEAFRIALQRTVDRLRSVKSDSRPCQTLSFFGAKGGAGTTTLAVNSATEIARLTKRPTLVIDLSPFLGQVALFLGVRPRFTVVDALDNLHRIDADFLRELVARHQSGLDLLAGSELVDRPGPHDGPAFEQLLQLLTRFYDFIIIDAGSVIGPCGETAVYAADSIYLVANPDVPSIRNAQRVIERMRQLGATHERVHVLLNRTSDQHLIAPRQIETALGHGIHHAFSSDYTTVATALNSGVPLSLTNHSDLAGQFNSFTRNILHMPAESEAGDADRRRGYFLGLF